MIIGNGVPSTIVDGVSLAGGTPFLPVDGDSACSVYELPSGLSVGVVYETGSVLPYLVFRPSIQMPPFARDLRRWRQWCFCDDDDRTTVVSMDPADGEVRYLVHIAPGDIEGTERAIREGVAFMDELSGRLLRYIREQWGGPSL